MSSTSSGWGSGPRTSRWPWRSRSTTNARRTPRGSARRSSSSRPPSAGTAGCSSTGATMQVSFLKDLVTMRDPTSPRSFLNYLQGQGRLADFINNKSLFPSRVEFHDYLEWCAADVRHLVSYGTRAVAVHPVTGPDGEVDQLDVVLRDAQGDGVRLARRAHPQPRARHRPGAVAAARACSAAPRIWHNSELLAAAGRARARRAAPPPLRRRRRRAERGGDDGRTCTTARTRPRCTPCSPATATARPTTRRSPTASSIPRPSTTSSRPPARSSRCCWTTTPTPTTRWSTRS